MPRKSSSLPKPEMGEGPEHARKVKNGVYSERTPYDPSRDTTLMVLNVVLVGLNLTLAVGNYSAITELGRSDQSRPKVTSVKQS